MSFNYNYIVTNNSFSMDTRLERLSRMKILADNIEKYASEVSLSQENLEWAQNAWKLFENLLNTKNIDLDEKNSISVLSQKADNVLYERYVIIKELLLAKLAYNQSDLIANLGLEGPIPFRKDERIKKAIQLIENYHLIVSNGIEDPLPNLMIENLKYLLDDAEKKLNLVINERFNAVNLTLELNTHFENDNVKLRTIYNWIVAFWGKKDPRLYDIGFVPLKNYIAGKSTDKVEFLKYEKQDKTFVWNKSNYTKLYQLAKRVDQEGREWEEIYCGENTFFKYLFIDDVKQFKIRAKNDYGYSDWSEILILK